MDNDSEVSEKARRQAFRRMEREREEHNGDVWNREKCVVCKTSFDRDEPTGRYWGRFIQAGGILAGPFCSRTCYYSFLLDGDA